MQRRLLPVRCGWQHIERLAWGLRSSFGYRFSPDGRLITTMNSANPMPPRGLYFDYEPVYEVVKGEWYGWPDYYSGIPITDERFGVKKEERKFVLTPETHQQLLKGKAAPGRRWSSCRCTAPPKAWCLATAAWAFRQTISW